MAYSNQNTTLICQIESREGLDNLALKPLTAGRLGERVGLLRAFDTLRRDLDASGAMAGLGGAYLSLVVTPLWVERMTAGRGWIALALVVFAAWRPWRVLFGAYLFGGITVLQLHSQALGAKVDAQLLATLPYLATIVVLVLISRDAMRLRLNAPACLGKPFHTTS